MMSISHSVFIRSLAVLSLILVSGISVAQSDYEKLQNYQNALEAIDANDHKTGYDLLVKEISIHPENGHAYFYLSYLLYENGDYVSASENVDKAISCLPVSDKSAVSNAYLLRSRINFLQGDFDKSAADLNLAIAKDSKNLNLYQARAELYSYLGRYDESDADYRQMSALHPGYAIAEVGLAKNDLARGSYGQAVSKFDAVIKKYPEYPEAYVFRAKAYVGLNKISDAADDIISSLSVAQNSEAYLLITALIPEHNGILTEKLMLRYSGDYKNPLWPFYIGYVNEGLGKVTEALTYYKESYGIDANSLSAFHISRCYRTARDWNHAVEYLDKIIASEPDAIDAYHDKADVYWYAGQLNKAVDVMTECLKKYPNNSVNYYRRGFFKDFSGDKDGALADYSETLARNPVHACALLYRGRLYQSRGYKNKAASDFQACVRVDARPHDNSSAPFALYYLGKVQDAELMVNEIVLSDNHEAYYTAARFYSLVNKKDLALSYLEKSLNCGFDNYHHLLSDFFLDNIRQEQKFRVLFEKNSGYQMFIPKAEVKNETAVKVVKNIPYTYSHGIRKVSGTINGYNVQLSYIPDSRFLISAYQAEYFLANGYIDLADISGSPVTDGKIPVGNVIKVTLKIGDQVLKNISAKVVSNDHSPFVFGNGIFGANASVDLNESRKLIVVTRKQ